MADPDDPHKFYQCAHGMIAGKAIDCGYSKTGEHLVFSDSLQTCVPKGADVMCPEPNGAFAYDGDDTKFIQCTDGIGAVMKCSQGLVFLKKCHVCGYTDEVDKPCNVIIFK